MIVTLTPGRITIRTMMIFTIKRSGKKKARWVVRRDQQVFGVDYWETSNLEMGHLLDIGTDVNQTGLRHAFDGCRPSICSK